MFLSIQQDKNLNRLLTLQIFRYIITENFEKQSKISKGGKIMSTFEVIVAVTSAVIVFGTMVLVVARIVKKSRNK